LTLYCGNIPFEDIRLKSEEFFKLKSGGKLPFGQVPVLEVDGNMIAQSDSILRFSGLLTGLYPECPWRKAECDQILAAVQDLMSDMSPSFQASDPTEKVECFYDKVFDKKQNLAQ